MRHRIEELLPDYGGEKVLLQSGAVYITKIPSIAPQAYMHSLYSPRGDPEVGLRNVFEYKPPLQFTELMVQHDGLSLFCGVVSLFSMVPNIHRSLNPEDLSAPALLENLEIFKVRYPDEWGESWRIIGEVTAIQRFSICINRDGRVRISNNNRRISRIFDAMNLMIEWVVHNLEGNFSRTGPIDGSYVKIDNLFSRSGVVRLTDPGRS